MFSHIVKDMSCSCGESSLEKMMNKGGGRLSSTLCKVCHNLKTIARGRQNKINYLDYKGSQCEKCGYNACVEALEFHHKDPNEKDPNFKSMRYWGLKKAKEELDKCLLLCCRCHREKHADIW